MELSRREQARDALYKTGRCRSSWKTRPLYRPKRLRHLGLPVGRVIDDNGDEKRLAVCHVVSAINRELPFTPEVTFQALLRSARDDGNEQSTIADVLLDLTVPDITASQLTLVEPDLDAGGSERVTDMPCGFRILRCIAQEHGLRGLGH